MSPKPLTSRQRKLRKLRTAPALFARDAAQNAWCSVHHAWNTRIRPVFRRRAPASKRRYSIVTAVYNVEEYLSDYFRALEQQTLSFADHIELILVDDGSTDGSGALIDTWQRAYPDNVLSLHRPNGGPAAARNLGLEHVTGDWVSFIDADDFVDCDYFARVDAFVSSHRESDLGMLCCRWLVFREQGNRYADSHPLSYRFARGSRVFQPDSDPTFLSPAVHSTFFRRDLLQAQGLRFDEQLRPHFEDAHFAGRYQYAQRRLAIGLVADARYYYRKRKAGTSLMDSGWRQPSRFDAVLRRGHLALLAEASRDGAPAPRSIQLLVLYDLFWYLDIIVRDEGSISFLSSEQRDQFRDLVFRAFDLIDADTVDHLPIPQMGPIHRIGMLGLFKGHELNEGKLRLCGYDEDRGILQLGYYYAGRRPEEAFRAGHRDVVPRDARTQTHDFLGRVFVNERRIWLNVDNAIEVTLNGIPVNVELPSGQSSATLLPEQLERTHAPHWTHPEALFWRAAAAMPAARTRFANAWAFIDRRSHADDNAEHLYRYVLHNHPDINAFFILDRESSDWMRLEREGFRLVPFGSSEHRVLLLNADHVASSHPETYGSNLVQREHYGDAPRFKFTFLQHGVIRDDISGWLNRCDIDLLITSSPAEHASIVADGTRYKFGEPDVRLVGLARHDALLERTEAAERTILIMPTWRRYLLQNRGPGRWAPLPGFRDSTYVRCWRELLRSPGLAELARTHGYRVVFFPHANMQPLAAAFEAPAWVQTSSHADEPVLQRLFRQASLLVTDYSSVFFEMAILRRAILHYQFDEDEMYGGGHASLRGYFDFEQDGFGPVARDQRAVLQALSELLARDCEPVDQYTARMERALPFRDGQNRRRTVEAMRDLWRRT